MKWIRNKKDDQEERWMRLMRRDDEINKKEKHAQKRCMRGMRLIRRDDEMDKK